MPYIDLGPAPSEDKPTQETGYVDLGPASIQDGQTAPAQPTMTDDEFKSRWSRAMGGQAKLPEKFTKQAVGALVKGGMRVGESVTAIPENTIRLAKTIMARTEGLLERVGSQGIGAIAAPGKVDIDEAEIESGLTAKLKGITDMHRRGQEAILAAHPEWESEPPESFVDLLTSPDKLALSLLESTPLLLAAGITTAAGQPALSVSMMFTTEFQDAKNQALADGRTEQEAQAVGMIYAPVAAVIEQMQLQGIMTVAKGMHKPLLGLVAKKVAAQGLKKVKAPIIKTMINEAVEEMAQGTWQEASAKIVYDKSVPGGLRGFIDRRAQEGLLGASISFVPGLGGKAFRGIAPTTGTAKPGAVRRTEAAAAKTKVQAEAQAKGEPLANVPTTAKFVETVVGKVPVVPESEGGLENIQNPTPIQTTVADRNVKLKVAHQIAKKINMEGREFEIYKETYGGQSSMADMTDEQLDDLIQQLQIDGTSAGLTAGDIEVKMTPAGELLEQVKSSKHYKHETEAEKRTRKPGIVRKTYETAASAWHGFWAGQDRIRNIARKLDNYIDSGPATRYLWDPIKKVRSRKEQSWNVMLRDVQNTWEAGGVDIAKMQDTQRGDVIIDKDGNGFPVRDTERIGLYLISKDKKANKKVSGWFEDNNIDSKEAFDAVTKSVESNEQEKLVADTITTYFKNRSPAFFAAAEAMGISVEKIKDYFPLLSIDPDLSTGEDIVESFLEHFENQLQVPGKQHTKKRTGGKDKVEWDAVKAFIRVSNRMESLIEVGPVAQQVYKLLKTKGMREAINDATFGKGADAIERWVRDSARGSSVIDVNKVAKWVANRRVNSVQYTLGLKLFTSAPKAALSFLNGLASEPAMIPYAMEILTEYRTLGGIKRVQNEVYSKSKIMENRNAERDIRTMWNNKTIRKFFAGKKLSSWGLRYWTHVDAATANAIWLAAYKLAKGRLKNMSESDARKFADDRAQESQPMASVEDLPDIFRGGELNKTVTTFMGMLNTTHQYLKHDIVGEYRAGKISGSRAIYRFMMGEMLPAMVLGVIVRGRLPETPGEVAKDLISYLMNPAVFFGRFLYNIATGNYDPVTTSISMMPLRAFEEAVKTSRAVKRGDVPGMVEGVARTYGATTGQIPEQAIITARGAYDLATGESDDWKRLMRTEGSIKYHASTNDTIGTGKRRRTSGRKARGSTRKRRSRS